MKGRESDRNAAFWTVCDLFRPFLDFFPCFWVRFGGRFAIVALDPFRSAGRSRTRSHMHARLVCAEDQGSDSEDDVQALRFCWFSWHSWATGEELSVEIVINDSSELSEGEQTSENSQESHELLHAAMC